MRRFDEALEENKTAEELDPLSPVISDNLADSYLLKNDFEAAIRQCQKTIELDPTNHAAYGDLGLAYLKTGRKAAAVTALEKAVETSNRSSVSLGRLAFVYAAAGRRSEARAILKELETRYAEQRSPGFYVAIACVGLDENDRAFAWLEKDFQSRSAVLPFLAHWQWFDPVRSDPRCSDLLRRMGLKA